MVVMKMKKKLSEREEVERSHMLQYIDVRTIAKGQGRSAYELTGHEGLQIDVMIDTHYDRPSNWARNVFCA